jgi:hypothetical protein
MTIEIKQEFTVELTKKMEKYILEVVSILLIDLISTMEKG